MSLAPHRSLHLFVARQRGLRAARRFHRPTVRVHCSSPLTASFPSCIAVFQATPRLFAASLDRYSSTSTSRASFSQRSLRARPVISLLTPNSQISRDLHTATTTATSSFPNPNMYTTSFAFFEALWDAGVSHCFVNLGSDHPSIIEAMVKGQRERKDGFPRFITCPNEVRRPVLVADKRLASEKRKKLLLRGSDADRSRWWPCPWQTDMPA